MQLEVSATRFGNRLWRSISTFALGALISCSALSQSVTTSVVVADGPVTSTKIESGGSPSIAVRLDIVVGQTLTVTKSGTGTGTVTSDVGAINCGATCSDIYPGTVVTLTATPTAPAVFTGWSGGGCSGTGTCVITVDAAKTVNAQFDTGCILNISVVGNGTVIIYPPGTSCSSTCPIFPYCTSTCSIFRATGTVGTLTALPAAGSVFSGWSGGGCSGTGTCVVSCGSVTVTFASMLSLTVNNAGSGKGTVTSNVGAINCGATCANSYVQNTVVTLTAAPTTGSTFVGWSGGGCSGTDTCAVTMTAAISVTATFTDVAPPIAAVTGFPANPSNIANPQFTFTSSEAGSTFKCQLDGGTQYACMSPMIVSVGNGNHTFTVIATDLAGNAGAPASYSWSVAGINVIGGIPALNEWMLMLLALLVGMVGVYISRHRGCAP